VAADPRSIVGADTERLTGPDIILAGTIVERQKDQETDETKIVIRGPTLDDREAETVVKIGLSGSLYVITVYLV
jgi:hypothetical protein